MTKLMKPQKMWGVVLLLFVGCTDNNEERSIEWIKTAPKPIVCMEAGSSGLGETVWTLIDAEGNVYNTGRTYLRLPDTIKVTEIKKGKK